MNFYEMIKYLLVNKENRINLTGDEILNALTSQSSVFRIIKGVFDDEKMILGSLGENILHEKVHPKLLLKMSPDELEGGLSIITKKRIKTDSTSPKFRLLHYEDADKPDEKLVCLSIAGRPNIGLECKSCANFCGIHEGIKKVLCDMSSSSLYNPFERIKGGLKNGGV